MLVRFSVGNFGSFNKNQTLSLISGSIQNHKERIYRTKDMKILKFASLFGANASGKSNFIKAISYAQQIVLAGTDHPFFVRIKDNYFKLDDSNRDKTTCFDFEFRIGDAIYAYGFEVVLSRREIKEE